MPNIPGSGVNAAPSLYTIYTHFRRKTLYTPAAFSSIFESSKHTEMKSYFKNEYRGEAEWAYCNWLDSNQKKKKKKAFSLASLITGFLPNRS